MSLILWWSTVLTNDGFAKERNNETRYLEGFVKGLLIFLQPVRRGNRIFKKGVEGLKAVWAHNSFL